MGERFILEATRVVGALAVSCWSSHTPKAADSATPLGRHRFFGPHDSFVEQSVEMNQVQTDNRRARIGTT
jgi:hypothetical protein